MSALPPIFIEASGHCGGMTRYTLGDAATHPENKFVRLSDYLALRDEHKPRVAVVTCPYCGNYRPGHATGGGDICDCPALKLKVKERGSCYDQK